MIPKRASVRVSRAAAATLAFVLAACVSARGTTPDIPLRVMTYNIQSGHGSLDGTAAAIRAESPDIVALQEVDVHWGERSGFADEATLLAEKLKMQVRFAPIYRILAERAGDSPREFGVALLSRYPIVRFENRVTTRLSTQVPNPVPAPMSGLLDATVDLGGAMVRVFDTHLDYRADPAVRKQQVAEMLDYIGDAASPTILMGDLNAEPDAAELKPLFERLRDAWTATNGAGKTYPADDPKKRIDYVLVSKHFAIRAATVSTTQASDHRPVIADLLLAH